jgi:ribosomal protein S2
MQENVFANVFLKKHCLLVFQAHFIIDFFCQGQNTFYILQKWLNQLLKNLMSLQNKMQTQTEHEEKDSLISETGNCLIP